MIESLKLDKQVGEKLPKHLGHKTTPMAKLVTT